MTEQLIAAFIISVLHGFIPGHWLPFLALAKKLGWSKSTTLKYTGLAAIAHAVGTVVVGLIIAQITMLGLHQNTNQIDGNSVNPSAISLFNTGIPFETFGASIMILLGIYFLYRHHKHHHFHFPEKANESESRWALGAILLAIFPEILRSIAAPVQQFLFGSVIMDVEIIRQLLYGLALILIMLYRPNGIWQKPEQLKRVRA